MIKKLQHNIIMSDEQDLEPVDFHKNKQEKSSKNELESTLVKPGNPGLNCDCFADLNTMCNSTADLSSDLELQMQPNMIEVQEKQAQNVQKYAAKPSLISQEPEAGSVSQKNFNSFNYQEKQENKSHEILGYGISCTNPDHSAMKNYQKYNTSYDREIVGSKINKFSTNKMTSIDANESCGNINQLKIIRHQKTKSFIEQNVCSKSNVKNHDQASENASNSDIKNRNQSLEKQAQLYKHTIENISYFGDDHNSLLKQFESLSIDNDMQKFKQYFKILALQNDKNALYRNSSSEKCFIEEDYEKKESEKFSPMKHIDQESNSIVSKKSTLVSKQFFLPESRAILNSEMKISKKMTEKRKSSQGSNFESVETNNAQETFRQFLDCSLQKNASLIFKYAEKRQIKQCSEDQKTFRKSFDDSIYTNTNLETDLISLYLSLSKSDDFFLNRSLRKYSNAIFRKKSIVDQETKNKNLSKSDHSKLCPVKNLKKTLPNHFQSTLDETTQSEHNEIKKTTVLAIRDPNVKKNKNDKIFLKNEIVSSKNRNKHFIETQTRAESSKKEIQSTKSDLKKHLKSKRSKKNIPTDGKRLSKKFKSSFTSQKERTKKISKNSRAYSQNSVTTHETTNKEFTQNNLDENKTMGSKKFNAEVMHEHESSKCDYISSDDTISEDDQSVQESKKKTVYNINPIKNRHGYIDEQSFKESNKLGTFKVLNTLGSGSSANVHCGVCSETGEKVAIKIVDRIALCSEKSEEDKEKREQRIFREVTISSLLCHPHIVRLKNFFYNDNFFYLIFEYVRGSQLLDLVVDKGPLKEQDARRYFRQILSAISYIHQNNIVHRDLKIENILLDDQDSIKILDFGLSNFFDSTRYMKTFCGSLYFAAPELLDGRNYCGPEIDVWSLGVILYVLLVGNVPFDDNELSGLHLKIKTAELSFPVTLSEEAKNLISGMICLEPKKRFTIMQIIDSKWINLNYTTTVDSFFFPRKEITELDYNLVFMLKSVFLYQFPKINEILKKHVSNAGKNHLKSNFNRPEISLYNLLIENFATNQSGPWLPTDIKTSQKILSKMGCEESTHIFVNFLYNKEKSNIFSKYFFGTVFKKNHSVENVNKEKTEKKCPNVAKDSNNKIPLVRKGMFKGIFKGILVPNSKSDDCLRKTIEEVCMSNTIFYEANEHHYICTHISGQNTLLFKISLYINTLFKSYYITISKLSGRKHHLSKVKSIFKKNIKKNTEKLSTNSEKIIQ